MPTLVKLMFLMVEVADATPKSPILSPVGLLIFSPEITRFWPSRVPVNGAALVPMGNHPAPPFEFAVAEASMSLVMMNEAVGANAMLRSESRSQML
jgi:hypothetical protein